MQFLDRAKFESRDNGRTPFQWSNAKNAGFTTGTPWIAVNPNYVNINAAKEETDSNSCLNYFRKLVKLRKNNPVLVYGNYTLLDTDNRAIYAYLRTGEGQKMLVLLNFSVHTARTRIQIPSSDLKLTLSNLSKEGRKTDFELRPYEALIYKVN